MKRLLVIVLLLVATAALAQEAAGTPPTTPVGTIEALIALVAAGLVSGAMAIARAIPALKTLTATAGTAANRALPLVCILLGIVVAAVQASVTGVHLRSAEGWGLLLRGVQWGLAAIGVQGLTRSTFRGK